MTTDAVMTDRATDQMAADDMATHAATAAPVLQVRDLTSGYEPGAPIVRQANLQMCAGEIFILLGPNGAGKSTLIKSIAGLVAKQSGQVLLRGQDITHTPTHRMAEHGLAFVPQTENVFVSLSIAENLGLVLNRLPGGERSARLDRIHAMFPDLLRLRALLAGRLSGGQRQMLAVARALVVNPDVLMLDEPSAGLSPKMVEALFQKLLDVRDTGVTLVMVEQNVRAAFEIADRACILVNGTPRYEGKGKALLEDPEIAPLYLGLKPQTRKTEGARP